MERGDRPKNGLRGCLSKEQAERYDQYLAYSALDIITSDSEDIWDVLWRFESFFEEAVPFFGSVELFLTYKVRHIGLFEESLIMIIARILIEEGKIPYIERLSRYFKKYLSHEDKRNLIPIIDYKYQDRYQNANIKNHL